MAVMPEAAVKELEQSHGYKPTWEDAEDYMESIAEEACMELDMEAIVLEPDEQIVTLIVRYVFLMETLIAGAVLIGIFSGRAITLKQGGKKRITISRTFRIQRINQSSIRY